MSPSTVTHIILLLLLHVCATVHTCPSLCYCNSLMVDCYDRGLEEIPEGINTTAVYVNIKSNRIKTITQERLSRLPHVENLRLGNNQITALQSGSFVNMTSLKQLDLSHNVISQIEPGAFQNLPKIKVLGLSENQLQEIEGFLSDLPSLERLDLSSNKLLGLSDDTFTYLSALNYLSLAGNQITSLSKSTFANLTLLSLLDLSRNPLKDVDSIWNGLSKLSSLHLSSCQLTKIPQDLPPTLGYLQLSNNSLTSITADDFSQTKYLSDIYLDDNDIKTIQDGAFAHCPYLSQISLNNNKLRILPKPIPATVTRFSADGNEIQRVFQFNFDHDSMMSSLSLKNNSIGGLVANTFARMAELRYLYLDSNNITVMYQMTYSRLRQLRTLSLNSNPIQEVEKRALGGLRMLSKLGLSGINGHVSGVKDDMFHDVPSVRSLALQGSPHLTASILNDTNVLQGLRSIKYLNLMENNLTKLDVVLRTWLPKLRSINLMKNQWRCDSELIPLRKWMDESPRTFTSRKNLLCVDPDFLKGQPIVDVTIDQFTATTTLSTTTISVTTPTLSTQYERGRTSQTTTPGGKVTTGNSGTAFISTTGHPRVKTTKKQRSTLAPPLTMGFTDMSFQSTPTSTSAKTSPMQTTRSVRKNKPTMTSSMTFLPKARTTTTLGAGMSTIPSSPMISSISTSTKIPTPSQPSTKTVTFLGSSFSSSEKLMTSSIQPTTLPSKSPPSQNATTKLAASTTSTARPRTATPKSAITDAPVTQKRSPTPTPVTLKLSSTVTPITRVTRFGDISTRTRKIQRIMTSASTISPTGTFSSRNGVSFTNTPYYIPSTSINVGGNRPQKKSNETASQRSDTVKSDQSRLRTGDSSSMNGKTKAIVIGVSVSLVCISIGLILLIVVLRYRKRQKSIPIDQNDSHPHQHHEDSSSDIVGIVDRMQGADVISETGKSTEDIFNGHQGNTSQTSVANGKKSRIFRQGSSSRFGMACFSPQSHDDSEMLVYSWDEPNH